MTHDQARGTSNAHATDVLIIGAGPAGLTAACELADAGRRAVVLESDSVVGGISRTEVRGDWRFDLGGHRFFTKVDRVREFWEQTLDRKDYLIRPRLSRIFFRGKLFDYPLKPSNALRNLGFLESLLCLGSFLWAKVFPPRNRTHFEGWVAHRFGWRLYKMFFKTYTEKVWGIPANQIGADWAAQRIKNLSLWTAVMKSLFPGLYSKDEVTSLIEEFRYPRLGPGMMWEAAASKAKKSGVSIELGSAVVAVERGGEKKLRVLDSSGRTWRAEHIISSMPINQLVKALSPQPPIHVLDAADRLRHRDFLTVALVTEQESVFPDNWVYIHAPGVRVGRVQNFGAWSEDMVKAGTNCVGLEYFVSEGDELWELADDDLIDLAKREIQEIGLIDAEMVTQGFVVRVPKAYPVYDQAYSESLEEIRNYLEDEWPEIRAVGRNGMHRYNNQDHSMLTAMLAVDAIVTGEPIDLWSVNVEQEYHEERGATPGGTGRTAPRILD